MNEWMQCKNILKNQEIMLFHFVKIINMSLLTKNCKNMYLNMLVVKGLTAQLACRFSAFDVTGPCY